MKTSSVDGFQLITQYEPSRNCQLVLVLTCQSNEETLKDFNVPEHHISCSPSESIWAEDFGVWIEPGDYLVVSNAGVLHMTEEEFEDVLQHAPELKHYIV